MPRNEQAVFFRATGKAANWRDRKYDEKQMDAPILCVGDINAHFEEMKRNGAVLGRGLADMTWDFREFVVRDCDGQFLCVGTFIEP